MRGVIKQHAFTKQEMARFDRMTEPEELLALDVFYLALKDIAISRKKPENKYYAIDARSAEAFIYGEETLWHQILGVGRLEKDKANEV